MRKKKLALYGCVGLLVGGWVLLGVLSAVGSSLDEKLSLHAESLLTAPPEALYATLTTQDALVTWWGQTGDPAGRTVRALPGPEAGIGMQIEVTTDGSITEQWILTAAEPPEQVRYTVDFQGFTVERLITFTPSESGTWATWDDVGVIEEPFMRFFTLLPEDILLGVPYTALSSLDAASQ